MAKAKPSRLDILVELLQSFGEATLATHAAAMPGYPMATAVAYATDERHRPVMLISQLAEHTRNLAANSRASFLVAKVMEEGEIARVSLVGDVTRIEGSPALVQRYLRYHPEAERFLQLGDFHFHRLEPRRALVVGGFAKAAWIDGERIVDAPSLPLEVEAQWVERVSASLRGVDCVLGIDPYGADVVRAGARQRLTFAHGPVVMDAMQATLERTLCQ